MLKALIIDDEENSRVSLRGKLDLFCPEIEVCGEAGGIQEALEVCREHHPDILFLDINLSGEDGFELLEALKKEEDASGFEPEIIFITAHDEYAIKAIKFSALDYLLKPIDPEELVKAVRKAEEKREAGGSGENLHVFMDHVKSGRPQKIVLPTSDGMHVLKISDIIRCESNSNYTTFYINNSKSMLASKTLKEFDTMLTPYSFERIHKSHLVNMNYVKRYVHTGGGYLIMEDDSKIPVANRKKEHVMKVLRTL